MLRWSLIVLPAFTAAILLALGSSAPAEDKKPAAASAADSQSSVFMECAKACDDCKRSCDMCGAHCAKLVTDGHKMHAETMKTCQDCAAVCSAAGCIVAKQGPFTDIICTACADACKRCGDACEKHAGHDEVMKKCMEECRKCEKACRDMLKK